VRRTSDWSATSSGFPKPFTLPGDDGPGLDEGECVLPASPERDMLGLEEPIGGMKLWSVDRLLVNGPLMLKRQDLQVHRRV
jgi:hypothetical protein